MQISFIFIHLFSPRHSEYIRLCSRLIEKVQFARKIATKVRIFLQIGITGFRIDIDFQKSFREICIRNSRKRDVIAFSEYVAYICDNILLTRKV